MSPCLRLIRQQHGANSYFASVAELDIDRMQDTCAWCFQRGPADDYERSKQAALGFFTGGGIETKACTGCKRVRYCSKTCQSKAWKREHKHECKVLSPESRPDLPHGVRAVIKLLGRLKNDTAGKDEALLDILQFSPAGGDSNGAALEQIKKDNPQRFEDFSMLAYGAWKYSGEPNIGDMDSEMIAKAFFYNVRTASRNVCQSQKLTPSMVGHEQHNPVERCARRHFTWYRVRPCLV